MSFEYYDDYASCKIISMTKSFIKNPISYAELSPQEFIAYQARVSNPSNQMNTLTSEKLLMYCIKNKHWSIFEMFNIGMEVRTTRDISHQAIRHSSLRFQEQSQRYANPLDFDDGFVLREARLQDNKNRQNSISVTDDELQQEWKQRQLNQIQLAKDNYLWAIERGIAKEQARVVLPEGLTKTVYYVNATLRSYIHYIQVRNDPSTQKEHRLIAEKMKNNLLEYFPFLDNL